MGAGEKTRKRFEAHGQKLAFDATAYKGAGPLWVYGQMSWKEQSDGKMHVRSTGLLTGVGDREIDGNHYCKLLSPARAMEWIYVESLRAAVSISCCAKKGGVLPCVRHPQAVKVG